MRRAHRRALRLPSGPNLPVALAHEPEAPRTSLSSTSSSMASPVNRYEPTCHELASAAIPGLVSKRWLVGDHGGTYGGVHVFESHQASLDDQSCQLFASVAGNPAFANVTAEDFGLFAGPSAVTGVS